MMYQISNLRAQKERAAAGNDFYFTFFCFGGFSDTGGVKLGAHFNDADSFGATAGNHYGNRGEIYFYHNVPRLLAVGILLTGKTSVLHQTPQT